MKVANLYTAVMNYFFSKIHQSIQVLYNCFYKCICTSFGDFTILMAFDNLLEDVCNDATVFFAMI
jgi:hypothetical protein